jgi:hypothetical protein
MTSDRPARFELSEHQVRFLARGMREAIAADLLRPSEISDAHVLLELLDARLPAAEERHVVGRAAGPLVLTDAILRALAAAEDQERYGGSLTVNEIDARVEKPEGTSLRTTLERMQKDKLIYGLKATAGGETSYVTLTSEGRSRARRVPAKDLSEHAVSEPLELLDLIGRAKTPGPSAEREAGGLRETVWIWHLGLVQGNAGVDRETFDRLLAALDADGLTAPGSGSYRVLTDAGETLAFQRQQERRVRPGLYGEPRLLAPVRRPRELLRLREDSQCPLCGHPAAWLRSRKGKAWDELRTTGGVQHTCRSCTRKWLIYAEPVEPRANAYDPWGDPYVARPRSVFLGGWLDDGMIAPPDHHRYAL